jgi:hypothetical protein
MSLILVFLSTFCVKKAFSFYSLAVFLDFYLDFFLILSIFFTCFIKILCFFHVLKFVNEILKENIVSFKKNYNIC